MIRETRARDTKKGAPRWGRLVGLLALAAAVGCGGEVVIEGAPAVGGGGGSATSSTSTSTSTSSTGGSGVGGAGVGGEGGEGGEGGAEPGRLWGPPRTLVSPGDSSHAWIRGDELWLISWDQDSQAHIPRLQPQVEDPVELGYANGAILAVTAAGELWGRGMPVAGLTIASVPSTNIVPEFARVPSAPVTVEVRGAVDQTCVASSDSSVWCAENWGEPPLYEEPGAWLPAPPSSSWLDPSLADTVDPASFPVAPVELAGKCAVLDLGGLELWCDLDTDGIPTEVALP